MFSPNKTEKEKEQKMSEGEAYAILDKWGKFLEVRLNDEDFEHVKKELFRVVQNERLAFKEENEEFVYQLRNPIKKDDGQVKHSMIIISDCQMSDKRDIQRNKNDIDKGIETFKAYTKDTEGNKIDHGFLGRIMTKDEGIITAVILGFFVQAVPGE